jgi:hypothetical protein
VAELSEGFWQWHSLTFGSNSGFLVFAVKLYVTEWISTCQPAEAITDLKPPHKHKDLCSVVDDEETRE